MRFQVIIFLLLSSNFLLANVTPIIINENSREILPAEFDQYTTKGPYDTFSYNDFKSLGPEFTQLNKKHHLTKGIDKTYWISFTLEGEFLTKNHNLLEYKDNRVDHFDIWINGVKNLKTVGTSHLFKNRIINHKSLVYDLPKKEQIEIVIRINSRHTVFFDFKVWEEYKFERLSLLGYILLGTFYGIFSLAFIFGFTLWLSFKENIYIGFALASLAILVACLFFDGTGFQLLWPTSPQLNSYMYVIQAQLLLLATIFYFLCFFDADDIRRKDVQLIVLISVVCLLLFIYIPYIGEFRTQTIFYLIPYVFLVPIFLKQNKNIKKNASYPLLVTSIISFYALFYNFTEQFLTLSWFNQFNRHIAHFSGLIFLLASAYYLFSNYAFYSIESENERKRSYNFLKELNQIKERINQEIQEKVQFQTNELEEKNIIISSQVLQLEEINEKLKIKSDQVLKLNLELNLENEDLKTNVKKIKESRILQNTVPFEDFKEYFNTDDACYLLLEELKWARGFKCTKCGNIKYGKGKGELARRCTKCGANESATTNTIFHRVHFPILKAFYILFLVNKHGDTLSSKQISESVDLRLATCWKFSKKIKAKKEEMLKDGKEIDSWIDLII